MSEQNEVTETKEKNGGDTTKAFTFRFVPAELHKQWKILASIQDMTMEDFGLHAIRTYILEKFSIKKDV